jgi:glutamate synthase domain-containing protein 3
VIGRHLEATGSSVAAEILASWDFSQSHFKRVAPRAEVARLEALFEGTETAYV